VAAVPELTDGGADFVYEAAGTAEAFGQGIAMARKGRIRRDADRPQAGPGRPRARRPWRVAPGGRDLLLVPGVPACPRTPGAGPGGRVEPLTRHVFPLDQAQEAFEFVLSRQGVKAILAVAGGEAAGAAGGDAVTR
jgi:hypothetical protein